MRKKVINVIAAARILLRRPSEQKLPTEDMRFLLLQVLEELHAFSIYEDADFFTHDLPISLTYNSDIMGFTYEVDDPGSAMPIASFAPVYLKYQPSTDDPAEDPWYKARFVNLSSFAAESAQGREVATMLGNNFQGLTEPNIKLNVNESFVDEHTWRCAFRLFPTDLLGLESYIPWPEEFNSLVEYTLADRALTLVRDDSPAWEKFRLTQAPRLALKAAELKLAYKEWLNRGVENTVLTERPYHYRLNNPLHTGMRRRYRTEWP